MPKIGGTPRFADAPIFKDRISTVLSIKRGGALTVVLIVTLLDAEGRDGLLLQFVAVSQ